MSYKRKKKNQSFQSDFCNIPLKNKNSYIGRTYKVNDNDLPHKDNDSNKIVNLAVIEENGKRIAGVRATTKETKNAIPFKNKHRIYCGYKTFLETKFQNGDLMQVDDKRLVENPWKNNLSANQVNEVRNKLYNHSKQIDYNKKQMNFLKNNKKK